MGIATEADSAYMLAGWLNESDPYHQFGWLVKIDASGNVIWEGLLDHNEQNSHFYDIIATPDGCWIAAGLAGTDGWLVKFDSSGEVLWQASIRSGEFRGICQVDDGTYVAAGKRNNRGWLFKFRDNMDSAPKREEMLPLGLTLSIYPNPLNSSARIVIGGGEGHGILGGRLMLYDPLGRVVQILRHRA